MASLAFLAAIPFVLFFTIGTCTLLLNHYFKEQYQFYRDREQLSTWNLSPRRQKLQPGEDLAVALKQDFNQLVEKGVRDRVEAESYPDKAERVWLSHHVSKGQLKHWTLISHGRRYEMRSTDPGETGRDEADVEKAEQWVFPTSFSGKVQKGCQYSIGSGTIEEEVVRIARTQREQDAMEDFFVGMIGWTKRTKEQLDAACRSVTKGLSGYNDSSNNSHHYLRILSRGIVDERAPDWGWLVESTILKRRYIPLTSPVALAILATCWGQKVQAATDGSTVDQTDVRKQETSTCQKIVETQQTAYVNAGVKTADFDFDIGTKGRYDLVLGEWVAFGSDGEGGGSEDSGGCDSGGSGD